MESQRLNFLPEAQNERNLLPLEAVKGFVAVTERLPPYLHALVLANLTSAVEDRAAARLIARVQKVRMAPSRADDSTFLGVQCWPDTSTARG